MRNTPRMSAGAGTFTEKDFYLAEFRGRTIGIALPPDRPDDLAPLEHVVADLTRNEVRVVLFCAGGDGLGEIARVAVDPKTDAAWSGALWRRLAAERRAAVLLGADGFAARCRDAVVRLRLAKLVWLHESGPIVDGAGRRISSLALPDLVRRAEELLAVPRVEAVPLGEVRAMLEAGVSSVSVCSLERLGDELFTYAGSGTFFTRERYADVRRLSLDDFDAAARLLEQGVAEGYLAPRSSEEIDAILSHGFGVFIEGRYLAGICALRPYPRSAQGEIAGLYTLTRFAGEGVGGHLVRFALDAARAAGLVRVFACTTSERVAGFFVRLGFEGVAGETLPEEKWSAYPEDRRSRLQCLAFPLG
jgi:N-acetylglutamate synthase-like GNAT family acetyltransferase